MARALEGVRVIDMGQVIAVPVCTMLLADLGAEVIRIEPHKGDDAREVGPFVGEPDKNRSGFYISLNRNKKGMILDLKHEKGKRILRDLIQVSDVIIENFRPAIMPRLGFGWNDIQKINPRVIYASISGFGHDCLPGYDLRPAYDYLAQAYSGFMSITGPKGGTPCKVGMGFSDFVAGHQAAIGILAALIHREKTGRGQYYDGSLIDAAFSFVENAAVQYTINGTVRKPEGNAAAMATPFQAFKTKDSLIIIPIVNNKLWVELCKALGREDLLDDPKYKTNPLRTKNKKKLIPILAAEFREKTTSEWCNLFEKVKVPYSPINTMKEICEDPHIKYRKMLVDIDQPVAGRMRIVGSSLRLSETPGEVYAPAPLLGQHSKEVLKEILGYSQDEIENLAKDGVIGTNLS